MAGLISSFGFIYLPKFIALLHPTVVSCTLESSIRSRLYSRKDINVIPAPGTSVGVGFDFQELFYQWSLTLKASQAVEEVDLRIDWLQPMDRISLIPEDDVLSELQPMWFSGFPEPKRKPDYYTRTVLFRR